MFLGRLHVFELVDSFLLHEFVVALNSLELILRDDNRSWRHFPFKYGGELDFAIAHVLHYDKLNKLVFDLYWNNQIIGQHIYIFNREGKHLTVKNTIDIKIKKLGINFYEYFSEGIEKYVDGKFESFASTISEESGATTILNLS